MATLATLLDVETEVETSLDAFLSAAPYSLGAIPTDTKTAVTTPRVEIKSEVIKWGPHQSNAIPSGTYAGRRVYDQFAFRITLDVVYQPEQTQGQASIRGTLRNALTDWTGLKAAFATRNYLLLAPDTLRQTDGGRVIDNTEKTETISTVLELVAFLNPDALNAAT